MANEVTTRPARFVVADAEPVFDTAQFDHMTRIATLMGTSSLLPAHLRVMLDANGMEVPVNRRDQVPCKLDERASVANAFLIVSAARNFGGIDPFALAQSSYFVHGRLGYEGKLVQALIERRVGAMEFEYNDADPASEDFGITVTAWVPNASPERQASVKGTVRDWASRKNGVINQQWRGEGGARRMLHYRGTREWSRLYAPALVLGLLDDDDLEAMREDFRARSARQVEGPGPGRAFNPLAAEPSEAAAPAAPAPARVIEAEATTLDQVRQELAEQAGADPDTGEIAQEAGEEAAEQPAAPETPQTPAPAAGGAPEATEQAKPSTKRLPRGFPQLVEIACMKLVQAETPALLDAAFQEHAVPLIERIRQESLPTPSIDRLEAARVARQNNFDTMARAVLSKEETAPAVATGPDHHPTAVETPGAQATPTAQQAEAVAPAEEGEDWSVYLQHLADELAAATTYEDVDDVTDTTVNGRDLPKDIGNRADDMIQARRKAIGDANAVQGEQAHAAGDGFPGESAIQEPAPTADQLQDRVDDWVAFMRKCKTVADLEKYNNETITPFLQGPHGKLVPADLYEDAKQTFTSRKRLLQSKEQG